MEHDLECECGRIVTVRETAAGATEQCRCGRKIVVPSLHELRRRAGLPEPGPSPEMVVETLLLAGKLPEEKYCVLCGVATEDTIRCITDCERAYVQVGRPPFWAYILGYLTFGLWGVVVVAAAKTEDREWGKDRIFPLPLRVCAECRGKLTDGEELKAALRCVPVYRRLLNKYPHAKVSLASL